MTDAWTRAAMARDLLLAMVPDGVVVEACSGELRASWISGEEPAAVVRFDDGTHWVRVQAEGAESVEDPLSALSMVRDVFTRA